MARVLLLSAGIFLFFGLLLPAAAPAAVPDGLTVTGVILKDDRGAPLLDHDSLLPLIETAPGGLFSREAVRKSIHYLYLEGKFRDVRVEAFPDRDGVRLEYTLIPIVVVDRLVLRGNRSLPARVIEEAARGIVGRELREGTFPDIRAEIQARYQAEGFYNTRVNFRTAPEADPHRVALFIYMTEPKRTVIEKVTFKGNSVLTGQELLASMRSRPGRPLVTSVLLEDDMEALRELYTDAGYPAAAAGPVSMAFQDERAHLEITVAEGPKVAVAFRGNREYCSGQYPDLLQFDPDRRGGDAVLYEACNEHFRSLLLFGTEHEVTQAVVESSADKVRSMYRDLGYADVTVDVARRDGPGTLDLVFTITEGKRVVVDEVRLEGNRVFPEKEIKGIMDTRESGWSRARPYREDIVEKDRDLVTDQYVAAGYLSAEVRTTATRTADGGRAVITLKIEEGRQTMTGDISFEGNAALSSEDLAKGLKLRTAAPFNERLLEEDRYRILSLYSERGYLYARVEAERTQAFEGASAGRDAKGAAAAATDAVHIRFRVTEDERVMIGKTILRGNVNTRDKVIIRELEPRSGEPYNYESILKSQQRLYRYGYFSLAKFEPVRPNEKEYVKDMLFTVEERAAGAVEFGVGYGDLDRLRGFVEVSHRNLWGTARYASLRFEASDILERAAFTFQEPWFLGQRNLDSRFLLAWSDSKRVNQDTREVYYQTRKTTASYGAERTVGGLKISLTYQYENVENYNVQPAAELSPEDSGQVLISSLSPALIYDKRDNPFNPRSGGVHGVNLKEAMPELGSEADFTKVTVQSTWFLSLLENSVVALSGRAGMGWPHQDTLEIPLHERFYLGGSTTVRGFTQDSVGPYQLDAEGARIPTGGSSMVQLNAEVRLNNAEGTGFVFFTDAGNVWVDQSIRLDDLRASYGAGFRYHTPVGPLRVDYGQKINRRSGESPGELHFSIGHAF